MLSESCFCLVTYMRSLLPICARSRACIVKSSADASKCTCCLSGAHCALSLMVCLLRLQHHQLTIVVCRIGASMLPVCSTVCKMVPEGKRRTTPAVLNVNDLAKLPAAKLRQIRDWLVATVKSYAEIRDLDAVHNRYVVSSDRTKLSMAPDFVAFNALSHHNKVCLTVSCTLAPS